MPLFLLRFADSFVMILVILEHMGEGTNCGSGS